MKVLLKEIRTKKRLSLRQLEYMTGIPRSTLSDIENHHVPFTLEAAEIIAKGLHMKISELYDSEYK